jgi:hypothetical protein
LFSFFSSFSSLMFFLGVISHIVADIFLPEENVWF